MKAIINGRIVTPTGTLEGKALLFDEKIRGIVSPAEIGDAAIREAVAALERTCAGEGRTGADDKRRPSRIRHVQRLYHHVYL